MNKIIATALGLAAFTAAYGQGTVLVQNNLGAAITAIFQQDGVTKATGADYKVQVFTYSGNAASPFGTQLGDTVTIASNGRFTAGSQAVPGVAGGATAQLIVRAWDTRTGADYASALTSGKSAVFTTGALGGAGNPPSTPTSMVTGLPTGFQSFSLQTLQSIPEPTTIALGALGATALFIRRRK